MELNVQGNNPMLNLQTANREKLSAEVLLSTNSSLLTTISTDWQLLHCIAEVTKCSVLLFSTFQKECTALIVKEYNLLPYYDHHKEIMYFTVVL